MAAATERRTDGAGRRNKNRRVGDRLARRNRCRLDLYRPHPHAVDRAMIFRGKAGMTIRPAVSRFSTSGCRRWSGSPSMNGWKCFTGCTARAATSCCKTRGMTEQRAARSRCAHRCGPIRSRLDREACRARTIDAVGARPRLPRRYAAVRSQAGPQPVRPVWAVVAARFRRGKRMTAIRARGPVPIIKIEIGGAVAIY